MKLSQSTKNVVLGGLMLLGATGSIKKSIDHTSNKQYNNIKSITPYEDLDGKVFDSTPLISAELTQILEKDLSDTQKEQYENQADNEYKQNRFPLPQYQTNSKTLQELTQLRDTNLMYAGDFASTGLEEYNINTRQFGDALCASAIWAKLRVMNTRSPEMRSLFGQKEKHTWLATQLLSSHGRRSITNGVDDTQRFDMIIDHYDKYIADTTTHYHDLLSNISRSQAGDFLTALYKGSHFKNDALAHGKHATHSLLSLGQQYQVFTGDELGFVTQKYDTPQEIITKDEEHKEFLSANNSEKRVILIYKLLRNRAIRQDMLMPPQEQKDFIRQIIKLFPDMIKVSRDCAGPIPENRKIRYEGVKVDHVYPLKKQEILNNIVKHYKNSEGKFIITDQPRLIQKLYNKINQTHADNIPYNFRHFVWELILTNQFLFCDNMTPLPQALSNYSHISPIYGSIEDIRNKLNQIDKAHTYYLSFDEFDNNGDRKINNTIIDGKQDKTLKNIINQITDKEFKNVYGEDNFSTNHIQQQKEKINKALSQYFYILGIESTGPIIAIPYLNDENISKIQTIYQSYQSINTKFQRESQTKYHTYIEKKLSHTKITEIKKEGHIVYPVCKGDDEITITSQICRYVDILIHNNHTKMSQQITIGNLSHEEYNTIYGYISKGIHFPERDSKKIKPKIEAGQTIHIDLGKIIILLEPYHNLKSKLAIDFLPQINPSVTGQFDDLFDKLKISQSIQNSTKHKLIREDGSGTGFFDIAKGRSRIKMMSEVIDLDDHNTLGRYLLGKIQSEGNIQIRLENFTNTPDNIQEIQRITNELIQNKKLNLSNIEKGDLQELINLCKKTYENKNDIGKFIENKKEIKHLLSDMINISASAREKPENHNMLEQIKLGEFNDTKMQWRYANILQQSIPNIELNVQEIAFIDHFTIIASHLGQNDGDEAFKIIISNYLIQKGVHLHKVNEQEIITFCNLLKQLNSVRKKESSNIFKKYIMNKKEDNLHRKQERYDEVVRQGNPNNNPYINDIIQYLNPKNKNMLIPHYKQLRIIKRDKNSNTLEEGLYISTRILESPSLQEFTAYLKEIPATKDKQSALVRFSIALLSGLGMYYNNKKRDIT